MGKLNDKNERPWTDCKSEVNGDDAQQVECVNRKGKLLDNDILESSGQQGTDWTKNGSSSDAMASTSETDMGQAKPRIVAVKSRQSRSGPLTPGGVLNHSLSEVGRNFERFVISLYMYMSHIKYEYNKGGVIDTPFFSCMIGG